MDTLLSASVFLSSGESSDNIWNAYTKASVITYIGYSKRIHTDQGPQFTSGRWETILTDENIAKGESRIERQNSIGLGEIYHSFLRKMFRKVLAEYPNISK